MPMVSSYWSLSGFYFFYFAFVGALSPYWSLYLKSLQYSAIQIALLMSLLQVMRMFGPNLWGWLADRTGKRLAIVRLAALLSLVCYAGVFFGTGFAWLFVVMAAMSLFWSASLPLIEATTLSHLGESTAKYGRIRSWGSIGFVLAVMGTGYVLDFAEIGVLLWILLGFKLGILAISLRIPEQNIPEDHPEHAPVWEILRRPAVIAFFLACMLMSASHGPYYTFYSIHLVDHGYSKSAVGALWALGVLFEIGVFFLMPRLMRRFSLKQILGFSLGCAAVRFVMIGWFVNIPALIWLAQILHAATFGAYHAAAVAVVHHFFKGRHQATGQALYTSLSFGVGGTLGGLASGYAWESLGPGMTFTLGGVAALAGLVMVAWKLKIDSRAAPGE